MDKFLDHWFAHQHLLAQRFSNTSMAEFNSLGWLKYKSGWLYGDVWQLNDMV